jgi:GxxExxY protein
MELYLKEECFEIIGHCMEVNNNLGTGFSEIVYKDALELEFKNKKIHFEREKKYEVNYKGFILPHSFIADFVVYDQIILEVKCVKSIVNEHYDQCINYLKVSNNQLALLVNFGESSLKYKRIAL